MDNLSEQQIHNDSTQKKISDATEEIVETGIESFTESTGNVLEDVIENSDELVEGVAEAGETIIEKITDFIGNLLD